MEALKQWWRSRFSWKARALCAERHEIELRFDIERAMCMYHAQLDECNALKEKMALLQSKACSDAKRVRRQI